MGNGLTRLWRTRRVRWGAPIAAGVLVLGAAGALALTADAGEAPARPVTVAVDRGPVDVDVATTGTVQPATARALSFTVSGTVASVAVRPGTVIQVGQQLATLSDEDVAAAADAVERAQQDLTDARDALAKASGSTAAATSCPAAGGPAAVVRPAAWTPPQPTASASPTPSATPSSAAPTASPSAAPSGHPTNPATRPAPASTGGPAPAASTRAPGGTTCSGGSRGGGDPILDAQRQVNQAEATLAEAESAEAGTTITAPIRGTVLAIVGKVGSKVGRGGTFITLADTLAMQVEAKFPEADAAAVAVGQHATVSLADRPGQPFPATVVQVDPAGTTDGTMIRYGVVLSFTDAPENLLVGQTAAVTVRTGPVAEALRVPSTALHDVTDGTGTVRVGAAREPRTVTVGLRGDQYTTTSVKGETIDALYSGKHRDFGANIQAVMRPTGYRSGPPNQCPDTFTT